MLKKKIINKIYCAGIDPNKFVSMVYDKNHIDV